MKRTACIIWLMVLVFAVCTTVCAQEKKPEAKKEAAATVAPKAETKAAPKAPAATEAKKEAATEAPKVVAAPDAKEKAEFEKKVEVFYQVASTGEAQQDPLMLIAAVKLLDDLPFKGVVRDAVKSGEDEKAAPRYDRTALLNKAKELAAGDKELLAVIARVQEPPSKTETRRHGHRGRHGHWGHHGWGGYYHHRPHHVRYGCVWMNLCGFGGCEWVCR